MAAESSGKSRPVLGIDIGGTKLAVGVVAPDGRRLAKERAPTSAREGPEAVIRRLVELCRKVVADAGLELGELAAAGVGCGGPLDPRAGIILEPPNLPGWVGIPLVEILRDALSLQVHLDNDANAAALGEYRFGAGRGARNMVYLTLSTGVGAGVILDGRLYQGENGNAAELGHTSVYYQGRPCPCGSRGCLEAYASGTNIAARAKEAIASGAQSQMSALAGGIEKVTSETVVEAVRRGDALAIQIWDETMQILGAGIANAINAFNPSKVVLGGGLTGAGDVLFGPVRRIALGRAMRTLARVASVVPAELGPDVGVVGAAAVAMNALGI